MSESFALRHLSSPVALDEDGLHLTPFVPLPSLPAEILGEIFIDCLEEEMVSPDTQSAPLLLCNVCRRWRDVALSTPSLWSSLAIHFPSHRRRRNLYRNWLSRAQNTPLSLCLDDSYIHSPDHSTNVMIPTLLESSSQWRNLKLTLGHGLHLIGLLFRGDSREFSPKIPSLEKLTLSIENLPDNVSLSFRDIPKLRHFALDLYRPEIQVPWHQLTTFRCGDITVYDYLEILQNSCNLVDCSFRAYHRLFSGDRPPDSHVDHPRLENLAVDFEDRRTLVLLDCLETPALKSLTLQLPTESLFVATMLSFISRSFIHLQTLAIAGDDGTIVECLKAMPSLVHLKLSTSQAEPLFIQLTGKPDFLPKLESLHVVLNGAIVPGSAFTVSLIIGLLRSRWAPQTLSVAQVRSFRLASPLLGMGLFGELNSDPELRRLKREGMVVYIGIWDLKDVFMETLWSSPPPPLGAGRIGSISRLL
ncbi:hypothetical protein C8F04DRAFT_1270458 [Mycena alexandri]|uniref:F-box domain-containing protein n=1 Tax=Mycena alexandri TaxID=1745969 RepID=A0AAD6SB15_9AGAR|nr:hypothetical protein C8F04DRAFT_1270458 [Mycena alexandri]